MGAGMRFNWLRLLLLYLWLSGYMNYVFNFNINITICLNYTHLGVCDSIRSVSKRHCDKVLC